MMSPTDSTPTSGARARADRTSASPDRRLPPVGGNAGRPTGGSVADLLRDLAQDTKTLVRQELELARMEITRTVAGVAKDGAWIAAGAATAAVGGLVLVVALALGLGALLGSYWLGTLITGALLVLAGALVAWKGVRTLKGRELAPTRTVSTLREDADWAREEARDFTQRLKE